ncbi:MAG: thrombospondin type 3 repeat-containing protein [Thermoanaerobaculum sp.]
MTGTLSKGTVLVHVDQQGKVLSQAQGFPGTSVITAEREPWLFQGSHNVCATGLEPLPSSKRTIRAVRTLLDRANSYPSCHWENRQRLAEITEKLRTFGPSAAPVLLEQLAYLQPVAFAACAQVLGHWRTRAAAPALWLWLMERGPQCQGEYWDVELIAPVFEALRKLRIDPWMVPSLAKLAADTNVEERIRIEAFITMADSQLPEAMAACDTLLAHSKPEKSFWFKPESPELLIPFVPHEHPLDKEVVREVEKLCERQGCPRPYFDMEVHKQVGARRFRWGNRELLLYFSPYLGGQGDLWLAEIAPRSKEPPKFTGLSLHGEELVPRAYDFRLEITRDGFSVYRALEPGLDHRAARGQEVLVGSCEFSELTRDQDGDGLLDIVEKRLRLDPDRRDTDSDGVEDSLDLCPNCGSAPETAEDHAAKALLWQFFALLGSSELRPAVVVWPRRVEFFVPGKVAIVLTDEEDERFRQEAGLSEKFDHIEINPPKQRRQFDGEQWPQELHPGKNEIAFELVIYRHGLNAEGYGVLLRATDADRYILVRFLPLWVS